MPDNEITFFNEKFFRVRKIFTAPPPRSAGGAVKSNRNQHSHMTKREAKNIPIPLLLEKLGFQPDPARRLGRDVWYRSPFRPGEEKSSFHVHRDKNVWYDFGETPNAAAPNQPLAAKGGDIFDLVMRLQNCDFGGALAFLEKMFGQTGETPKGFAQMPSPEKEVDSGLVLESVTQAFAPSLLNYVSAERKIPTDLAREHLRQVHFSNAAGRKFYGAGMKNRSGGWEIRNPYFKGCIGKRDFTFIPGNSDAEISIFEGMFDFLSALTWYGKTSLFQHGVLVLHSLSCQMYAVEFLKKERPQIPTLKLYLSNDDEGQKAFEFFKNALPERLCEPCFALYFPHRDFNEFLMERRKR